jgi:hypothetical protein
MADKLGDSNPQTMVDASDIVLFIILISFTVLLR